MNKILLWIFNGKVLLTTTTESDNNELTDEVIQHAFDLTAKMPNTPERSFEEFKGMIGDKFQLKVCTDIWNMNAAAYFADEEVYSNFPLIIVDGSEVKNRQKEDDEYFYLLQDGRRYSEEDLISSGASVKIDGRDWMKSVEYSDAFINAVPDPRVWNKQENLRKKQAELRSAVEGER